MSVCDKEKATAPPVTQSDIDYIERRLERAYEERQKIRKMIRTVVAILVDKKLVGENLAKTFAESKFSEGAWKLPSAITEMVSYKGFYVPIPKVGKAKGKKGGKYKVTKMGKGLKAVITVHKTFTKGGKKAWTREVGTAKQWAQMGGGYKGPSIGTAISSGFASSKDKIVAWYEAKAKLWIKSMKMKKGALRAQLGIKEDETIPAGILNKISKAEVGSTVAFRGKKLKVTAQLKRRVSLALKFKKMKK